MVPGFQTLVYMSRGMSSGNAFSSLMENDTFMFEIEYGKMSPQKRFVCRAIPIH